MVKKDLEERVDIPEGVTVKVTDKVFYVSGPKGEVIAQFNHPKVQVTIEDKVLKVVSLKASKKEKAVVKTYAKKLMNSIKGVQEEYVYKLKICSGHFPVNVKLNDNVLVINNFLGEKVPRKVLIKTGAKVEVKGSEIFVSSPDKNLAGQVSADIEKTTRRNGFDKRIFQDGIYIVQKGEKVL